MYNFTVMMKRASSADRFCLELYLLSNGASYHYLASGNIHVTNATAEVRDEVMSNYVIA